MLKEHAESLHQSETCLGISEADVVALLGEQDNRQRILVMNGFEPPAFQLMWYVGEGFDQPFFLVETAKGRVIMTMSRTYLAPSSEKIVARPSSK